jgi:hypothetical protein
MKKTILAAVMAAIVLPAAPAMADPGHGRGHGYGRYDRYDNHGRYREPRPISRNERIWRGRDGRYYCKRSNGTTGLIIGAAGGALVGRAIDTRGDRTMGTLLGAVGGGLLGREIDRGGARCR